MNDKFIVTFISTDAKGSIDSLGILNTEEDYGLLVHISDAPRQHVEIVTREQIDKLTKDHETQDKLFEATAVAVMQLNRAGLVRIEELVQLELKSR